MKQRIRMFVPYHATGNIKWCSFVRSWWRERGSGRGHRYGHGYRYGTSLSRGLACGILLLLLLSCGGSAPKIVELRWRLNINFAPRERDRIGEPGIEALSVFVRPSDEDGIVDLDSMYLINPAEDLFWALDSSQWQTTSGDEVFWIGSNRFSSGYMQKLPRGDYIVELYDKSGEWARQTFELRTPDTSLLSAMVSVPPVGDELLFLLPGEVSLYSITGYNVANVLLFTDANYQSIISLRSLKVRNDELEKVVLSFEFPDSNVVAQLGPYQVPRVSSGQENLASEEEGFGEASGPSGTLPDGPDALYTGTEGEINTGEDFGATESSPIDTYIPDPEEIREIESDNRQGANTVEDNVEDGSVENVAGE
ncbi:hypothetical protein P0082_11915 [Candidatus Haliotispira prima]|uniref:DUF4382 domain-containing protein n=1 Tax=Candidatus Haliotispira prima TaxID=3034016 RepID=A0ABY8MGN1_9SPIO|nr:hypothetical protein P0082_11915 [Candidatus Haliotispira prima]